MVMNGRLVIVAIFLLSLQFQVLDSKDEARTNPCLECRHCKTQGHACRWNRKRMKREVMKKVTHKITKLEEEFQQFKNFTKRAFRRLRSERDCPLGYIRYKKHCFQFVMSENMWKKWDEARNYCQNANANLLYLNSTKKHEFIVKYLRENFHNHVSTVFTSGIFCDETFIPFSWTPGGHRSTWKYNWKWLSKKSPVGNDTSDLQWCSDTIPEGDKIDDINSCLILSKICDWKWSAGKCGKSRPFICEMALNPKDRKCLKC